jgi:serine/threonine protein kinase
MPHTLVYWAPELLKLEEYNEKVDLWAIGVSFYQVVTGEHPFNVSDEESFRTDALSANVDWSKLEGYPLMKEAIFNLIKVNPERRWSSAELQRYI